jgi:hypothetical protein
LLALSAWACPGAAQEPGPPSLPLAEATEWQVLVFGARVPSGVADKPVPFTVKVAWQAEGAPASRDLPGKVSWLKTERLALSVPAGCRSLSVGLDWQTPGVDLDLGLECPARGWRLAPLFTVLKPERVRLDAQTAPFHQWLASRHPDWWRAYPFWAEIAPAPKAE